MAQDFKLIKEQKAQKHLIMHDNKKQTENNEPALEKVAINPNPRANENLTVEKESGETENSNTVGSEITDGEDA